MQPAKRIIHAPGKMLAAAILAIGVCALSIPVGGAAVGVLAALGIKEMGGGDEAAWTAFAALLVFTVPLPYLLFCNWRFRLELTELELIAGRWFPKRFFYRDIRRISVCPAPRKAELMAPPPAEDGFNSQAFLCVKSDRDSCRIHVPTSQQDSLALELLDLCPNAVLIDAHQREHFPRPLAAAVERNQGRLSPFEAREMAALLEEASKHHRLYARIFTMLEVLCWAAIPIVVALLLFDPKRRPGDTTVFLRVLSVLVVIVGWASFAGRRSRQGYREGRQRAKSLRGGG